MPIRSTDLLHAMTDAWNAGDPERVIALSDGAALDQSHDDNISLLLALATQATGRWAQSAALFDQLTRLRPAVSAYWNNLAVARRQANDLDGAEQAALTARTLAPDDAEVHYNLGLLYIQQRRWLSARETLLEAAQLAPDFIEARLHAAHACYVCGDNTGQTDMLAGAATWPAQAAEQALVLATMLSAQGELDSALDALARATVTAGPLQSAMRMRLAAQRVALHERNNQLQLARDELQQLPLAALENLPPEAIQARVDGWRAHAAVLMRLNAHADAAALYRRALAIGVDEETRASAAFGLAAACDRQGLHDQAWQALTEAHAAQLAIACNVVPELLAPDSQPLNLTAGVVGRQTFVNWKPLAAPDSTHSPVFVLGFPRSGTTLLEQMLDAHPQFQSMDERAFVHELIERMEGVGQSYPADLGKLTQREVDQLRDVYARMVAEVVPDAGMHRLVGKHRLVDKNPLNMLCLPMIMRLFPHARIILCLRHPCDVLLSCSMQPFRSPAFMVLCSSLQRLAQGYVRAFEQWQHDVEVFMPQVLEWRYELVVTQFDEQVTRLGNFLQVSDPAPMTRFAEHARQKRFISTPSYAQVTKAVHRRSVGRWEPYREHFEPVLPLLQPWLERLGYSV